MGRRGKAGQVGRGPSGVEIVDRPFGLVELVGDEPLGRLEAPVASPADRRRPGRHRPRRQPSKHAGQTDPFLGLALGPSELFGNQVDFRWATPEQPGRIEIGLAGPDAEVETLLGGAEDLTLADLVAPAHPDESQEGVAGAQPIVVEDDDMEPVGHRTGEHHFAGGRREDRCAPGGGVLQAPVAGIPVLRRRAEPVDDRRVDRWSVGDGGRAGRGPGRYGRDQRDERGQHDGQPAHGDPQERVNRWGEGGAGRSV
jgi:hypothetical protein